MKKKQKGNARSESGKKAGQKAGEQIGEARGGHPGLYLRSALFPYRRREARNTLGESPNNWRP